MLRVFIGMFTCVEKNNDNQEIKSRDACSGPWNACPGLRDTFSGIWDTCSGLKDACSVQTLVCLIRLLYDAGSPRKTFPTRRIQGNEIPVPSMQASGMTHEVSEIPVQASWIPVIPLGCLFHFRPLGHMVRPCNGFSSLCDTCTGL